MSYIYTIVKADYLQRTRSYAFIITLAITIYAAYSFVPPPAANYTTLSMVGYKGVYNAAWAGYVSAMMTSIMLTLCGYFLVNSGIKKDIETEVGLIIATTPITNFSYLFSKMASNLLVLLTIAGCTFIVSILLFFVRAAGYPFILSDFAQPYLFFVVPALFVTAALAVAGEVFSRRRPVLQYILFFLLFILLTSVTNQKNDTSTIFLDVFGVNTMTTSIKEKVNTQYHAGIDAVSLGYTFNNRKNAFKTFTWEGINWTGEFLLSRLMWICLSIALVYLSSLFFHRFDFKQTARKPKKNKAELQQTDQSLINPDSFSRTSMPPLVTDYGIFPFIKTELLLLIRKGNTWFWLIAGGLWLSMLFIPLAIAHTYLLPVLWFLMVTHWSELSTKEKSNRLHYFTYSSYKPLQRMLPAQIMAGVTLAVVLALPVLIRYLFKMEIQSVLNILNGSIFIILLAVGLGILSDGKKLFEILFFILTYLTLSKAPFADYSGAVEHDNPVNHLLTISALSFLLALLSFSARNYRSRHLS